jgi:hypothetical protein
MSEMSNGQEIVESENRRRWIIPRIVAMLCGFVVVISALVIVTDYFSPRDRHPELASASAPATKGGA